MLMGSLPTCKAITVHPKAFLEGESVTDTVSTFRLYAVPTSHYTYFNHMTLGGFHSALICSASPISVILTLQKLGRDFITGSQPVTMCVCEDVCPELYLNVMMTRVFLNSIIWH